MGWGESNGGGSTGRSGGEACQPLRGSGGDVDPQDCSVSGSLPAMGTMPSRAEMSWAPRATTTASWFVGHAFLSEGDQRNVLI